MLEKETLFLVAKKEWKKKPSTRSYLLLLSSKKDLDSEVKWFEAALEKWFDKQTKVTRITLFSKKWWNDKLAQVRKTWSKGKKRLDNCPSIIKDLKKAQNAYYYIIEKAKIEY